MFKSLKLYVQGAVDLDRLLFSLVDFGYKRQDAATEEGDFARRGGVLDIFPFSFELPIRIELTDEIISSIKTYNPSTGIALWEHRIVIILPVKKPHTLKTAVFKEDFPLTNFVDLNAGDYVVHNQHGIGRFLGLQKIKVRDKTQDHLVIE